MGIGWRVYLLYLHANFYVEEMLLLNPNPDLMDFGSGFAMHDQRGLFSEFGPI